MPIKSTIKIVVISKFIAWWIYDKTVGLAVVLFFAVLDALLSIADLIGYTLRYSFLESAAYGHFISDGLDLIVKHRHLAETYKTSNFIYKPRLFLSSHKCSYPPFIKSLERHFKIIHLEKLPLPDLVISKVSQFLFQRNPVKNDLFRIRNSHFCLPITFVAAARWISSRDLFGLRDRYPLQVTDVLDDHLIIKCRSYLESHKINVSNIICVHIRTPAWYQFHNSEDPFVNNKESDSVRNITDPASVVPGLNHLLDKGYSIVQIGRKHERLDIDHAQFLHLDSHLDAPAELDLYLYAITKGVIGTGCGPDNMNSHFNNGPACIINQHPHIHATTFIPCVYHPPHIIDVNTSEVVSLGEYLYHQEFSYSDLSKKGLSIKPASADSIRSTFDFFATVLIEKQPYCHENWRLLSSKYINCLALYHVHYLGRPNLADSVYSYGLETSYPWHFYMTPDFHLSPHFLSEVGEEWLDIRYRYR
ncbi:TIGR04372 family glycosyltransferase [Synechococcus sp. MIT S9452]|uniref:TIGR04372 family glycosyltransferase n=1 Tax=Synechococcus sp. MIT S9452 TaxID=3082546 RepID=UPI0039A78705